MSNTDIPLSELGGNLLASRKKMFPGDTQKAFAKRIGVGRATLQRMEAGDLTVSIGKYYSAAKVLNLEPAFAALLKPGVSLFDD